MDGEHLIIITRSSWLRILETCESAKPAASRAAKAASMSFAPAIQLIDFPLGIGVIIRQSYLLLPD